MANLYPPYIDAKLPAQVGDKIIIPYKDNRGTKAGGGINLALKIKTINTNVELGVLTAESAIDNTATFNIGSINLAIGQYYKVQLAYKTSDGVVGLFSTVGIFKYTSNPILEIETKDNIAITGIFTNSDTTEVVYSYNFKVLENAKIIYETGELLHNSSNDTQPGFSFDAFTSEIVYNSSATYTILYSITTQNGYKKTSEKVLQINADKEIVLPGEVRAVNDFNQGCVIVSFFRTDNSPIRGRYRITRSSSLDNYATRSVLSKIVINEGNSSGLMSNFEIYKDYTIQQGVSYIYGLQQYYESESASLSTAVLLSNYVVGDFEDAFLFDGSKQLKMRFNPKVSSFKNTLLEQKVDTIGGKSPFIFRNNNIEAIF